MPWKFHTGQLPLLILQSVLILIALVVQPGCAIQCFVCDSSVNPGCANLRSNSSIVPETCTLDKMKTINTWLFELNEISYFESELYSVPTMFCQKVIARRTPDSEPITARFCQLDTRETNACSILKDKLPETSKGNKEDNLIHCSICSTDRCNSSGRISMLMGIGYLLILGLVRVIG